MISPRIILGAVTILLVIVAILALQNINREKRYMSRILSEKGAALIKAVEAGARTGMMGMRWGDKHIQTLLEETAGQPDILYIAVTDMKGYALAHSSPEFIGKKIRDNFPVHKISPEDREYWHLAMSLDGKTAFEVFRFFRPLKRHHLRMYEKQFPAENCPIGMKNRGGWCFPSNLDDQPLEQLIFVGLDVAPFEEARRQDVRNTIIISSVLVLLGFGGFLSLFWANNYRIARQMLQDTSAFADEVVANLPVGLIATDRDGLIAFFNEAAEKITGKQFSQVKGKSPELIIPSPWNQMQPFLNKGERIIEQEIESSFSGQEPVPLSISATTIVNEDGDFVGNLLILRDMGEVRRLQEEIRRQEKLAALGKMAAGVAHEIRNPLSSIKGLASYFGSKFSQGSEDKEAAEVMVRETDRLNRVVSELLNFARPSDLSLKPENISRVIENSLRLIQQDARMKNIRTEFNSNPGIPDAILDPDRFSQCLLNLYLNAIESMNKHGTLSVHTSFNTAQKMVQVNIKDTGKGIHADNLKKYLTLIIQQNLWEQDWDWLLFIK